MTQTFVLHGNDRGRERVTENLCDFVRNLDPAKAYEITVKQYRKKRSDDQNAALWGLAYPIIAKATGQDDVNEWHTYMLGEHFGWVETVMFGKRKLRPARTTTTGYDGEDSTLSTAEFAEFFDFIQRRAAQNGIFIPDPDPHWKERRAA